MKKVIKDVQYDVNSECEYFGQLSKGFIFKTAEKTSRLELTIKQARELRDILARSVAHAESYDHQEFRARSKRSHREPISQIRMTIYHDGHLTVLGENRLKKNGQVEPACTKKGKMFQLHFPHY